MMFKNVPTLAQLIRTLQKVPYLSSKNIYRVASYFLHFSDEQVDAFCAVLKKAKQNIVHCDVCFNWREKEGVCVFCTSSKRDQSIICILETWQDVLTIERTEGFEGVYHILGGVICPLDGIGPDDLTIDALIKRVKKNDIKEIIFALNQTPEGEATSAYINKKLHNCDVIVSCLARGIPVGSSIETMDRLTVYKALSERRPF